MAWVTMVPAFLPPEVRLVLQSENGFVGLGSLEGEAEPGAVDAGGGSAGQSRQLDGARHGGGPWIW
ncbi:MAG: hypothetical protein P8Z77_11965 [Candidatus Thiodiazotropha sp.]